MPTLADELSDIRTFNGTQGPRCGTGILLAKVDEPLRDSLVAAFDDPTLQSKAIGRWLRARHDITLSPDSIQRHRRGDCNCG